MGFVIRSQHFEYESYPIDLRVLTKGLTTVTLQDVSWRGHSVPLDNTIRSTINELMDRFKTGSWSLHEKDRNLLLKLLFSLEDLLLQEVDVNNIIDLKADRKMRAIIEHRLLFMEKILNRFGKRQGVIQDVDELVQELEKLRHENLNLLEQDQVLLRTTYISSPEHFVEQPIKKRGRPRKSKLVESNQLIEPKESASIGSENNKIKLKMAQKQDVSYCQLLVSITQSLIGNCCELVDDKGNKFIQNILRPAVDTLKAIANRNYKDYSKNEIKREAQMAIDILISSFKEAGIAIPLHIQQQIDELKETITAQS